MAHPRAGGAAGQPVLNALLAIALSCVLAVASGPAARADAAAFVPGRPGNTESPVAVPPGLWQVESEVASYAHDRAGGVSSARWDAAVTSLRYGLAPGSDAEAILRPYARQRVAGRVEEGFGDVTLRARHMVAGADGGAALALLAFLDLPTVSRDLGVAATGGGLILTAEAPLGDTMAVTATLGAAASRDDDGTPLAESFYGVNLGRAWSGRLGSYVELFADSAQRAKTSVVTQLGLTWQLDDCTQLDVGGELGVTRRADDARGFIGWAHRY